MKLVNKKQFYSYKELSVLSYIVELFKQNNKNLNLGEITFICIQHLFFTTVSLIEALIDLGAMPHNIHIIGKIYSTCPEVVNRLRNKNVNCYGISEPERPGYFSEYFERDISKMWANIEKELILKPLNKIIILDDGGKCLQSVPTQLIEQHKICGVEQTSFGATNVKKFNIPFPVINVAYSAAKQTMESPMIAEAVVNKLEKLLTLGKDPSLVYGVVGLGAVGQAVANKLSSLNYQIMLYDRVQEKCFPFQTINNIKIAISTEQVFTKADYIFGCTGEDITLFLEIDALKQKGSKHLISCSSQDIEFQTFLRYIDKVTCKKQLKALDSIEYKFNDRDSLVIYNGGYPINLDNSGESVPAKDIQLTRGLLLGGVLQASCYLEHHEFLNNTLYMLSSYIQQIVVQNWLTDQGYKNMDFPNGFTDKIWIQNNSEGTYLDDLDDKIIADLFTPKKIYS